MSLFVLWLVGIQTGIFGADGFSRFIFHIDSLDFRLQVLYGISELFVGIVFFISLGRQLLPQGFKSILEEPATLAVNVFDKVRYLPDIFALGVIIGLAGHGVYVLVLFSILYFAPIK